MNLLRSIAAHQNYYFKDSVAYTVDHIPVQKLYFYKVPPEVGPPGAQPLTRATYPLLILSCQ